MVSSKKESLKKQIKNMKLVTGIGSVGSLVFVLTGLFVALGGTIALVTIFAVHTHRIQEAGAGGGLDTGGSTGNSSCPNITEYTGIPKQCFGIDAASASACSGHGTCDSLNACICNKPYTGDKCNQLLAGTWCGGVLSTSTSVCSGGHGVCQQGTLLGGTTYLGTCQCLPRYTGSNCEIDKDDLLGWWNDTMTNVIYNSAGSIHTDNFISTLNDWTQVPAANRNSVYNAYYDANIRAQIGPFIESIQPGTDANKKFTTLATLMGSGDTYFSTFARQQFQSSVRYVDTLLTVAMFAPTQAATQAQAIQLLGTVTFTNYNQVAKQAINLWTTNYWNPLCASLGFTSAQIVDCILEVNGAQPGLKRTDVDAAWAVMGQFIINAYPAMLNASAELQLNLDDNDEPIYGSFIKSNRAINTPEAIITYSQMIRQVCGLSGADLDKIITTSRRDSYAQANAFTTLDPYGPLVLIYSNYKTWGSPDTVWKVQSHECAHAINMLNLDQSMLGQMAYDVGTITGISLSEGFATVHENQISKSSQHANRVYNVMKTGFTNWGYSTEVRNFTSAAQAYASANMYTPDLVLNWDNGVVSSQAITPLGRFAAFPAYEIDAKVLSGEISADDYVDRQVANFNKYFGAGHQHSTLGLLNNVLIAGIATGSFLFPFQVSYGSGWMAMSRAYEIARTKSVVIGSTTYQIGNEIDAGNYAPYITYMKSQFINKIPTINNLSDQIKAVNGETTFNAGALARYLCARSNEALGTTLDCSPYASMNAPVALAAFSSVALNDATTKTVNLALARGADITSFEDVLESIKAIEDASLAAKILAKVSGSRSSDSFSATTVYV